LQRTAQQNLHLVTMGKMMASLAHQIRTPLASSMLYLSQCVDGALDHEGRQYARCGDTQFIGKYAGRVIHQR
jgi:two-component system sensor histidine kinase FlrB